MTTAPITPAPEVDAAATENVVAHIESDTAVTEARADAEVAQAEAATALAEATAAHAEEIVAPPEPEEEITEEWLDQRFSELRQQVTQFESLLATNLQQLSEPLMARLATVETMLATLTSALIPPVVVTSTTPPTSETPAPAVTPQSDGEGNPAAKTATKAKRFVRI